MTSLDPQMPRRIRITGREGRARVLDSLTGDVIKGVSSVEVHVKAQEPTTAVLTLMAPEVVDLDALAEMVVDPTRLAVVLWKRALEKRGVSWGSDSVIRFEDLPDSERDLWLGLARASFEYVRAFNARR